MKDSTIEFVDDQAVADVLLVSKRVIGNLTRAKKIPCIRVSRKKIRYVLDDVLNALKANAEDETDE
jgi:hypothetical protein